MGVSTTHPFHLTHTTSGLPVACQAKELVSLSLFVFLLSPEEDEARKG